MEEQANRLPEHDRQALSTEPAIEVRAVRKKFRVAQDRRTNVKEALVRRGRGPKHRDFYAVDDVTLTVPRGSTYGLIGHNGSGKSTLLKTIAGIHLPTTGEVVAHGRVSALLEVGAGFHPELSGRENIYLNGAILGMTKKQIAAAMDDIIEFSGLGEFIDTPVKVYSSGMYVRLGFAIAVNLEPEILIVDEIVAVGDEEFQRRCLDYLHDLRKRGTTIVVVSHSLPMIQQLCDRVAWLDHGKLVADGPAQEVCEQYLDAVNAAEEKYLQETGAKPVTADDESTTREGSGEVRVTAVSTVDDAGAPRSLAANGEPVTFKIEYEVNEPVDGPIFFIDFYTENGLHLAGPDSWRGGLRLGKVSGPGVLEMRLPRLPLLPGVYSVSAAVASAQLDQVYDRAPDDCRLRVRQKGPYTAPGIITLDGEWAASVGTKVDRATVEKETAEIAAREARS
jgi:ABC-2 type transport system ATP-binding protein/lipopolysaccharide transport system ATP-binding protein